MLLVDSSLARYAGLGLAVIGNVFIGISFGIIKIGTNRPNSAHLWWLGQALMAIGEVGNFAAYGLAPPSIVASLGAIAVLVNQVGSSVLLREPLTMGRVFGTLVVVLGSTLIVVAMPPKEDGDGPSDVPAFGARMQDLDFMLFVTTLVSLLITLLISEDKRNRRNPANLLIDVGVCTVLGCFTVMLAKCVSMVAIDTFLEGNNQFVYALTYVLLGLFASLLFVQQQMLTKALSNFDTALVIPPYFVLFNIATIAASALLFGDFSDFSLGSSMLFAAGLALTFVGIFLLFRR